MCLYYTPQNSGIREELYADLSQVQNDIMVLTNIAEEVSQPVNHTVIVSGFNIYEECTTHTETCTISDVPASATQHPCLTVEAYVDIPVSGSTILPKKTYHNLGSACYIISSF